MLCAESPTSICWVGGYLSLTTLHRYSKQLEANTREYIYIYKYTLYIYMCILEVVDSCLSNSYNLYIYIYVYYVHIYVKKAIFCALISCYSFRRILWQMLLYSL